jgi:hypothetical protein
VIEVILGLPICVLAMAGAFSLQGGLLLIDEFYFHRRRGLGLWERVGHPIDNLLLFFPLVFAFFRGPESDTARWIYFGFSALSCLLITKDEWVHTRECGASENWLHALLFVLHPVALGAAALAIISRRAASAESSASSPPPASAAGAQGRHALAGIESCPARGVSM